MADTSTIPNLTFVTDGGVEVRRFYNRHKDPFGGRDYRDLVAQNLSRSEAADVARMMAGKPRTYEEYVRYVQSNGGEQ